MRYVGFATSAAATASSVTYESRVNTERPVWKFTPFKTSVGRGVGAPGGAPGAGLGVSNRMMQPLASTALPAGVLGHLSRSSGTPSPSESLLTGHPVASTAVPGGV